MKDWEVLVSNLLSGGAAGASSLTVTYPLDMARTRYAFVAHSYFYLRILLYISELHYII